MQHQQYGIRGEMMHCMPVFSFKNQAFAGMVKYKSCSLYRHYGYNAASVYTYCSLYSSMVPVSASYRIINAVYVEYSFYFKRDIFFNNGEAASFSERSSDLLYIHNSLKIYSC